MQPDAAVAHIDRLRSTRVHGHDGRISSVLRIVGSVSSTREFALGKCSKSRRIQNASSQARVHTERQEGEASRRPRLLRCRGQEANADGKLDDVFLDGRRSAPRLDDGHATSIFYRVFPSCVSHTSRFHFTRIILGNVSESCPLHLHLHFLRFFPVALFVLCSP